MNTSHAINKSKSSSAVDKYFLISDFVNQSYKPFASASASIDFDKSMPSNSSQNG